MSEERTETTHVEETHREPMRDPAEEHRVTPPAERTVETETTVTEEKHD